MAEVWRRLEEAQGPRGSKSFGARAVRLAVSLPEEVRRSTWLLDKKVFRKTVSRALPPGHEPMVIQSEPATRRHLKAARAYQRMLRATSHVPDPPKWSGGEQSGEEVAFFVWSSTVLKPRGFSLVELEDVMEVEPSRIPTAVCSLWASAFFDTVMDSISSRTSKLAMAIGLTVCPLSHRHEVSQLLARETTQADLLPLHSHAPTGRPDTAFDIDLFRRLHGPSRKQWSRLSSSSRKRFTEVLWGRPGIRTEVVEEMLDNAHGPLEGQVLADLFGRKAADHTEPLGLAPRRWWSAVRETVGELAAQAEVAEEVDRLEHLVKERFEWMQEMDLALLPDDGLRRSLEELFSLLGRASSLAAKLAVTAGLQARLHSALTGLPVTQADMGLKVPLLHPLGMFQEALEVVRADQGAHAALVAAAAIPDGPGRRALLEWCRRNPELLPFSGGDVRIAAAVQQAATRGLRQKVDVSGLSQAARVEADRIIAQKESLLPRPVAAWLAPLRTLARESVLLRERARMCEVKLDHLLRRVVLDVDRRLLRLDVGLSEGSAFHCTVEELVDAVDLRGTSLRARVAWRRAEHEWSACHPSPFSHWETAGSPLVVEQDVRSLTRAEAAASSYEATAPIGRMSLAVARQLHCALVVPYEPRFSYTGRVSDTLPTTARSLGVS